MNNYPQYNLSPLELFRTALTIASEFTQELENIEKRNRYDDNTAKFVVQATRLYEQGKISKEDLINIVSKLPDNRPAIDVNSTSSMDKPKPTVDDLLNIINQM